MGLTRRQGRQPRAAAAKGKGKAGKKARAAGAAGAATKSGGGGGGGGALRKRLAQDVYDYGSEARGRRGRDGDEEGGEEDYADRGNPQYAYKRGEQEDEEIDEEGAFDSDDERRYGDLLREIEENDERRASSGRGQKRGRGGGGGGGGGGSDDDDDEEEEEEEEGEGGGMLLSDMLGGEESGSSRKRPAEVAAAAAEEEEEEDSESGSEDDDDEEEEEEEEEAEAGLMGMVDALIAEQQAAAEGGGGDGGAFLQGMRDSAFGTRPVEGLTMEAMLGALQDTRGFAAVKKRLAAITHEGAAVAAPAPTTVQARAERQLAYAEKRREVGEWLPLVAAARQAESLNFSYEAPVRPSQAALVGKFDPQTEMERAVRDLLVHARADREAAVEAAEGDDLGARGLTAEQVKVRRAELAKMRALLFYEQQKRHRANKIKSKAYHRIRKRQRIRQEEASREALRALDPDAARELDEKEALARAQERMSLRHKNTTKWAQHAKRTQGATAQASTRRALTEQLELGQQLRKKSGLDDDADSDSEEDSDGSGGEGAGRAARIRARAAGRVRTLLGEEEEEEPAVAAKGLMGMAFMARAVERQRARAREEVEAVLRELEQEEDASSSSSSSSSEEEDDGEGEGKGKKRAQQGPPPAPVALKEGTLQAEGLAWGAAAGGGKAMRVAGPITIASSSAASAASAAAAAVTAEEAATALEMGGAVGQRLLQQGGRAPAVVSSFVQEAGVGVQMARQGGQLGTLSAATISPSTGLNAAMGGGGASAAPGQFEEEEEEEEEEKEEGAGGVNPWLAPAGAGARAAAAASGGASGQRGLARRGTRAATAAATRAAGVIDVEGAVAAVAAAAAGGGGGKGKKKPAPAGVAADAASSSSSDGEGEEGGNGHGAVVEGRLVQTAEQAALVQRAFANADPEGEEFRQEKAAAVEAERAEAAAAAAAKDKGRRRGGVSADKASGVAGWGSWAGAGAAPAAATPPPPPASGGGAAAAAGARRGLAGSKREQPGGGGGGAAALGRQLEAKTVDKGLVKPRMDRALPTVIINERRVKKAASLKVSEVPYPFTSRQQYERAMRRPVGKEWNTALAVRDQTRPAVKVRPGTMVRPIKLRKTHKAVFAGSV